MKITTDWHIHSHHSDGRCTLAQIVEGATAQGITDFAVTDHFFGREAFDSVHACRDEFLSVSAAAGPRFHYGIELNVRCRQPDDPPDATGDPDGSGLTLDFTAEDVAACGIELVVAAAHKPISLPESRQAFIEHYHSKLLWMASHPLVDIVAHPWGAGYLQSPDGTLHCPPWFDDFTHIPHSVHNEFAAALLEHDTPCEVNTEKLIAPRYTDRWKRQYLDYVARLCGRGVTLAIGSDCHRQPYRDEFQLVGDLLESVGVREEDLFCLPAGEDAA